MASLITDNNRLLSMLGSDRELPAASRLYREGEVFFVGGELPIYETLETMFNSFCTEATALFYLTLGEPGTWLHGEEMARQVKKNFNIRLFASLDEQANPSIVRRLYAAGVDNLDIRLSGESSAISPLLLEAKATFPEWGVAATLPVEPEFTTTLALRIDQLVKSGIVPLVQLPLRGQKSQSSHYAEQLEHLVKSWDEGSVPIQIYLPLVRTILPLVPAREAGVLSGIFNKLLDRHRLAGSNIRRHLRVQLAENSLDSAGL